MGFWKNRLIGVGVAECQIETSYIRDALWIVVLWAPRALSIFQMFGPVRILAALKVSIAQFSLKGLQYFAITAALWLM